MKSLKGKVDLVTLVVAMPLMIMLVIFGGLVLLLGGVNAEINVQAQAQGETFQNRMVASHTLLYRDNYRTINTYMFEKDPDRVRAAVRKDDSTLETEIGRAIEEDVQEGIKNELENDNDVDLDEDTRVGLAEAIGADFKSGIHELLQNEVRGDTEEIDKIWPDLKDDMKEAIEGRVGGSIDEGGSEANTVWHDVKNEVYVEESSPNPRIVIRKVKPGARRKIREEIREKLRQQMENNVNEAMDHNFGEGYRFLVEEGGNTEIDVQKGEFEGADRQVELYLASPKQEEVVNVEVSSDT